VTYTEAAPRGHERQGDETGEAGDGLEIKAPLYIQEGERVKLYGDGGVCWEGVRGGRPWLFESMTT